MFNDTIRGLLGARRREIDEARQRKRFEDLIEQADNALLRFDERETAANERALTDALDSIKAHVLARLIEREGDASALPLGMTLADGRTVREVCAEEIAAVAEVPTCANDICVAERFVAGDRARLAEARMLYIEPLESALATDLAEVERAKMCAAEAERHLDALKRKYHVG